MNYDYSVFDNEEDYFENGDDDGDDKNNLQGQGLIYSDFNNIVLEPSAPILEDHDSLAAFDSLLFWNRWIPEEEE